jgi:16S rRNA G527 N7-methylase RsmG
MTTAYTREITTTLGSDLNNRDDVRSPDLNKIEKQLKNYGDLIDNNNEAINLIKSRQN